MFHPEYACAFGYGLNETNSNSNYQINDMLGDVMGESKKRGCEAYRDVLVDLSDGELPHDQSQVVENHLAECTNCRSELARLDSSLRRLKNPFAAVVMASCLPQQRRRQ